MRVYEYGGYPARSQGITIAVGDSRRTWCVLDSLPTGVTFDEYQLDDDILYSYKVISDNCVEISNIGEEPITLKFIRRFKKKLNQ